MSENKGGTTFLDIFVPLLTILAIIGLGMYVTYDWLSAKSRALHGERGLSQERVVEERIRPIGRVAIAGQDQPDLREPADVVDEAPAGEPAAVRAEARDGQSIYNVACTVCHGAGIAGAPRTGDEAGWAARMEQGMDSLVTRAIEGFQGDAGYMPPRGGHPNLSDEEVRNAVEYMVDQL